jgi:hypothetical protein
MNLTICSAPRRIETAHYREFEANKDTVEDLDAFSTLN